MRNISLSSLSSGLNGTSGSEAVLLQPLKKIDNYELWPAGPRVRIRYTYLIAKAGVNNSFLMFVLGTFRGMARTTFVRK